MIKAKADIAALQKKIAENDDAESRHRSGQERRNRRWSQRRSRSCGRRSTPYDQVIAEKTKEQEQIKQQIKTYEDRVQSSPASGAAIQGTDARLSNGAGVVQRAPEKARRFGDGRPNSSANSKASNSAFSIPRILPEQPSFPNRPLFALGGLGGGLGAGHRAHACFWRLQNTSMRSERDVEFALRLPVLAIVPAIEPVSSKKTKHAGAQLPPVDSTVTHGARA